MDRRTRAMLAAATVAVLVTGAAGVASARTSAPQTVPQTLAALEQKILAGLSAGDWRHRLSSLLAQAATARPDLSLTGSARGAVLGGTVHLPSTLALDGETTIVAQRIVLSSPTLRVTGSHPLRLYPVAALTVAGQAPAAVITIDRSGIGGSQGLAGGAGLAGAGVNGEIDHRGTPGNQGFTGAAGLAGTTGSPGLPGEDAIIIDEEDCQPATSGRSGGPGSSGTGGGQGTPGGDAGAGTDITLDIPDGSTEVYFLRANGGAGGQGGQGGQGGPGGWGGAGGRGGNGFAFFGSLSCAFGGSGGWGGPGGSGGAGGQGGRGGQGGHGGDIAVTYPAGYNPANIHAFVDGGVSGPGGPAGLGGFAGRGGRGGLRGQSAGGFPTFDGVDGIDGVEGNPGTEGAEGIEGEDGAIDIRQRFANDDICAGMQSQPETYSALRQNYHNLLASDPFPAEEPPETALPDCEEPPPPPTVPMGALDLVFGDSYISGEGAPPFDTDPIFSPTASRDASCHVSVGTWPALIYNKFPVGVQTMYQNYACSGGKIADTEQQVRQAIFDAKVARQDGVKPRGLGINTDSVQVSAGGNDVSHVKKDGTTTLTGLDQMATCAVTYGLGRPKSAAASDCLPTDVELAGQADGLIARLAGLYAAIAAAAPNAIIEVAGYPRIFSNTQSCPTGVVRADEQRANIVLRRIDLILRRAVREAQARDARLKIRYIALDNALTRHNACPTQDGSGGTTRNTHGINVPFNSECGVLETACLLHPNHAGHQAMAATYTRLTPNRFPGQISAIPTPGNGTLIADASSNSVYVAAGGALFPFNNPADITAAGYTYVPGVTPQKLDPDQIAALAGPPADGTVLRDAGTGTHYLIACGFKAPIGATAGAVNLPSHSINGLPDGWCPVTISTVEGTPDDRALYLGQPITYTITGTPLQPIFWSSWICGNPPTIVEDNAFYNQYTDQHGRFVFTTTWTDPRPGCWTKKVKIGDQTGQINLQVTPAPGLLTQANLVSVHTDTLGWNGMCLDVFGGGPREGANVQQSFCKSYTAWRLNPVGENIFQVVNLSWNLCLEVAGAATHDGAEVQISTCHGGTNQQWRLSAAPFERRRVTLTAVHSGKCLDVAGAAIDMGATVWQWTCHGGTNQLWKLAAPPPPDPPPAPPPPPGEFE